MSFRKMVVLSLLLLTTAQTNSPARDFVFQVRTYPSVHLNQEIWITLALTNISRDSEEVQFGDFFGADYKIVNTKTGARVGRITYPSHGFGSGSTATGYMGSDKPLAPGGSLVSSFRVSSVYAIKSPGTYAIRVTMGGAAGKKMTRFTLQSNTVTIRILP